MKAVNKVATKHSDIINQDVDDNQPRSGRLFIFPGQSFAILFQRYQLSISFHDRTILAHQENIRGF